MPNPVGSRPELYEKKIDAKKWYGRALWDTVNSFQELTHNYRCVPSADGSIPVLAQFLRGARIGTPNERLLTLINSKCHVFGGDNADADPRALWMAPTKDKVGTFNEEAFKRLDDTSAPKYRAIASHEMAKSNLPMLSNSMKRSITEALFKVTANRDKSDFNGEMLVGGNY